MPWPTNNRFCSYICERHHRKSIGDYFLLISRLGSLPKGIHWHHSVESMSHPS